MVPVGAMGRFRPGDSPFQTAGEAYRLCPKWRAQRMHLAFLCFPSWEASVTLYLWFQF